MPYFTKNEAGEYIEVPDDTLLQAIDVKKHPDYVSADNRIKELNKEAAGWRKKAQALVADAAKPEADEDVPPAGETPKPAKTPTPEPLDIEALTKKITDQVSQQLAAHQIQTQQTSEALDAILEEFSLPITFKGVLAEFGSVEKAKKHAKTIAEAGLVFPAGNPANAAGKGFLSEEMTARFDADMFGVDPKN